MHLAMDNICFFASKGIRLNPRMEFDPVLTEFYATTLGSLFRLNLQIFRCLPSSVISECPSLRQGIKHVANENHMGNVWKIIVVSTLMEIIQEKLWQNEPQSTFHLCLHF